MVLAKNAPSKPSDSNSTASSSSQTNEKKKAKTNLTRIVIRYDVGFNNSIFIRGSGAGLSWDKGIKLMNTSRNEWVWETDKPFNSGAFKVLINDSQYEQGDNHTLICEKCLEYTPRF